MKMKKPQNMKNIQVIINILTKLQWISPNALLHLKDSEEETGPRLKPIFVSKKERITIAEKEKELQKQKLIELEAKKLAEERRRYTLKVGLA